MAGKITRKELSSGLVSELNKSGSLSELATENKDSLVSGINEVLDVVETHKASNVSYILIINKL